MASNVALLTQSHKVVNAKRRQKLGQVNAVVFNEDARREFLTGFHKRKLAKKEESKKKAQAREKEERLEARREQRRMLAEQAVQNAAKVEEAYGAFVQPVIESDDEEWTGISRGAGLSSEEREAERHEREREREYEYEYSDEERLATVTVVEDFDPSLHPPNTSTPTLPASSSSSEEHGAGDSPPPRRGGEGGWEGRKRRVDEGLTAKTRKVAVRYETKAARRAARATQRARRTEKAERAGGKAARRKNKNKKNAGGGKRSRG